MRDHIRATVVLVALLLITPALAAPDGRTRSGPGDDAAAGGDGPAGPLAGPSLDGADAGAGGPDGTAFPDLRSIAEEPLRQDLATAAGIRAWRHAALSLHQSAAAGPLSDLLDVVASEDAAHGQDDPAGAATDEELDHVALPAGDLDGDGLRDVLDARAGPFDLQALEARRGTDGSLLWSLPADEPALFVPLHPGDVTGDGADDVLLWTLTIDDVGALRAEYRWGLTLVSGPDGTVVWQRTYPGSIEGASAGVATVLHATNFYVLPFLAGDLDGDGARDIVTDALDLRAFGAGALVAGHSIVLYSTRAEVVSGADGTAAYQRSLEDHSGLALMYPAGDAVGDATGDLLWEVLTVVQGPSVLSVRAYRSVLDLEMVDGASFEAAWRTRILRPDVVLAYAVPAGTADLLLGPAEGRDLTGDGAADVLLLIVRDLDYALGAVSGADGEVLWMEGRSLSCLFRLPVVLGPVDGAPGSDLLVMCADYAEPGETFVLERVDGATGQLLFSMIHGGTADVDVDLSLPGDVDGDGVVDIAVAIGAQSCLAPCDTPGRALVESGATGSELLAREASGFVRVSPAGDLDGDGRADVVASQSRRSDSVAEVLHEALAFPDAEPAWNRTDLFSGSFGWALVSAGDATGDGRADLLYRRFQLLHEADDEVRFDVLDGTDGSAVWGAGDELTAPDPSGGGDGGDGGVTGNFYVAEEIAAQEVNASGWTRVAGDDEGLSGPIEIATTPFFDDNVTEMTVSSNGFVYLGQPGTFSAGCCDGYPIPRDDNVNGVVAGAWTDLDGSECGTVSYDVDDDRVRVAFEDVPYFNEECRPLLPEITGMTSRRVTFWMEITPTNGTIEVHVLRVDGKYTATTGIEAPAGDVGNQTRRTSDALAEPAAWRFLLREGEAQPPTLDQDDAGSGGDAGDSLDKALAIAPGDHAGTLETDQGDDEDWYALNLTRDETLAVDLEPATGDLEVDLYDPDGNLLASSDGPSTSDHGTPEHVEAVAAENGTHYVRIYALGSGGDYTFTVAVSGPPEPLPVEPRVETLTFVGDIDCAAAVAGILVTNDLCDALGVEGPPRGHSFPVVIDPGATSIHVEVHWDPDDAVAGADRLLYYWAGFSGALEGAEGPSPIVHDQDIDPTVPWHVPGRNGTLAVQVSRNASGPVVLEQPFTLCVAIMYGGADLPADYACEA